MTMTGSKISNAPVNGSFAVSFMHLKLGNIRLHEDGRK